MALNFKLRFIQFTMFHGFWCLTDMLFIYSIVLFIYSTTGWSRASTLYVWIQAGNRYRKPVQHSIAKVLRFTAKKWTRLELQDPLPKR